MNYFKKILLLTLVLSLTLSALMSCGILKLIGGEESEIESVTESETESQGQQNTETESESSEDNGIILLETPVVIADGDNAYFIPVKPNVSNDVFATCISELRNPADGFTLSFGIAKETDNDNTDGEILIGNTCRPQSKAEMDKIGYDDFSVTYVDNKIVVAAHTPERLTEAVKFLKENLLRVKEGKLEYIGNYVYKSDAALMLEDGESFEDYKIVLGHDDLYMSAYTLQQYIKSKYGAVPKIIFDNTEKTGKEIVLGNVKSREISALAENLTYSEGLIAVKDKDILIATKDILDTQTLFDIFAKEYLSETYTDHFNFKADFSRTVNIYDGVFKDSNAFTEGSDIRVMSFNILVDIWADTPAVKGRDKTVMAAIKNYMPDAVGFQEASRTWHNSIKSYIKDTPYELINTEHDHVDSKYGNLNFVPILYNTDTLTLIECDTAEYTEAKVRYMRTMSYAYFEVKATGERFVLLNTHYEAPGKTEAEKAEHLEYRNAQTEDMVAIIAELKQTYGCPIVVTGDFNNTEGNDKTGKHAPYWNLVEGAGLHEAKYTADRVKLGCSTYHELGQSASISSKGSFDHIFGTERVHFTYYNTLVDKAVINASDHCPIYADMKLN